MIIFNKFRKVNKLPEKEKRWNLFIDDICNRNINELNNIQKTAVLCFWYDAEMNSGGHSGYFDCYSMIDSEELYKALSEVGSKEIADNYKKALKEGKIDDYEETDYSYYEFNPSLQFFLEEYVEQNKDKIFI